MFVAHAVVGVRAATAAAGADQATLGTCGGWGARGQVAGLEEAPVGGIGGAAAGNETLAVFAIGGCVRGQGEIYNDRHSSVSQPYNDNYIFTRGERRILTSLQKTSVFA